MRTMNPVLNTWVEAVRHAHQQCAPLVLRGGASKAFMHAAAPPHAAVLDTRGFAGIDNYEPSELVVTVRAGTPLAELQAALAEKGQLLAFDPPHFAWLDGTQATVGGMLAAGLSGPSRASVGSVRDHVLGVQFINGQGHLLRYGGEVMKNVAGYDVSRLLAGSMGTLGLIAQVSLKVLPQPTATATLGAPCTQTEALQWLNTWGGQPLPLHSSAWVPQADGAGQLWLRLAGAQAAVDAAQASLGASHGLHALDPYAAHTLWADIRDHRHTWFAALRQAPADHALWRISVPQSAPPLALPPGTGAPLVEWHGGLRWVLAPLASAAAIQAAAQAVDGFATVFVAASALIQGAAGPKSIETPLDAVQQRVQAQVKAALDPAHVLNPGRRAALI
jgi:glycolate oxidase FAD binding subunit